MAEELLIQIPNQPPKRLVLEQRPYSLGRAHGNDLCYPEDASLSRRHLVLECDIDGWSVCDQGSKNGTLVNGQRVAGRSRLRSRDQLVAGQVTLTFIDPTNESDDPRIVFEVGAGPELHPNATVMTSLGDVLSSVPTSPDLKLPGMPRPARPVKASRAPFEGAAVSVLIRAGRELAQHRPLGELFELILALSIEAVGGERGVLLVLEGERLAARAVHGGGFRISTTVRDRVLKEKSSLLVRDMGQEEALRAQASIFQQQVHSLMAVPLQTEDRVLGLIYIDSSQFQREFTPHDLNLLTVLANVAAIRIEQENYQELRRSEERQRRELEQAAEIQRGILPAGAPSVPGLDLAGFNAACRTVGGDYYDFLEYPDGRVGLVVGDVAGKGMSAAILMSNLQARVQVLSEAEGDLGQLMSRLDRALATKCPSNRFITLFYGLIDPVSGRLQYCNAGHNAPLIVRASGEVVALRAMGTVLGVLPELGYTEQEAQLAPGDLIAVYSDGVTEAAAPDEEEFGEERLMAVLREHRNASAAEIVTAVQRAVDLFTESAPPADDVTLVVARHVAR